MVRWGSGGKCAGDRTRSEEERDEGGVRGRRERGEEGGVKEGE